MTPKMVLRCGILMVLALVVSASVNEREKRQTTVVRTVLQPTITFEINDDKETLFVFDGESLVRVTSRVDDQTEMISVGATDHIICNLDDGTVTSPSLPGVSTSGIGRCSGISTGSGGFTLSMTTSGSVNYTGPGVLYLGPENALFVDEGASGVSNFIESSRPSFIPVIPPLDIAIVSVGNDLALNLNDETGGQGNPPDNNNNGLRLTGADCIDLQPGDSVTYGSGNIRVRRGSRVIADIPNIASLDSVLDQIIAGRRCTVLTRDSTDRAGFFSGPGVICSGMSATTSDQVAFFSNSSSAINNISRDLTNRQLQCQEGEGITGNFPPNVGRPLVGLAGAEYLEFSGATSKVREADGSVSIIDRFDRVLRSFTCNNVAFSCFERNRVTVVSSAGTIEVSEGGLSVIFNPDDCSLFAYPTQFRLITALVNECRATLTATAAPDIFFRVQTNSFGTSTLTGDDNLLLTTSSSRSFPVRSDQFVRYENSRVEIVNNGGGVVSTFDEIGDFSANTAFNRITSHSGSAENSVAGDGTLHVDETGRAFFTNQGFVNDLIQTSIDGAAPQRVNVVGMTVNGSTQISFQTGGTNFFNYGQGVNVTTVGETQGLVYNNGNLDRVENVMRIPGDSTFSYYPNLNLAQLTDRSGAVLSNLTDVDGLLRRNNIGGIIERADMNFSLPGGGLFFRGAADNLYLPSGIIDTTARDTLNTIGALSQRVGFQNVPTATFQNGNRIQTFSGSSSSLFPGRGSLFRNNDGQFFYSNNQNFLQRLRGEISNFNPTNISYSPSTGTLSITSFFGEPIASVSIGSRVVEIPGGTITFEGGNITTSAMGNNFIAGGIQMLTYYNGISFGTLNAPDRAELPGNGLLLIDEPARTAFYTTDPSTINRLRNTISNAVGTFRPPNIPITSPAVLRSKLNKIDAGFGQRITVFAGADVCLKCFAGEASPPATITFSERTNFSDPSRTVLNESANIQFVMTGANEVTLLLTNISESDVEYTCQARSNNAVSTRSTRVTVLPGDNLRIDNNAFLSASVSGTDYVTAVGINATVRVIEPILAPRNNVTIAVIAENAPLSDAVSIGCKTLGRPKARITWFRRIQSAGQLRELVNTTSADFNVTARRQGQSLLTVRLSSSETSCFEYICAAENGVSQVEAMALVCPRRYELESITSTTGSCSATCGVGLVEVMSTFQLNDNSGATNVMSSDLPPGLVKPVFEFCTPMDMSSCPVVAYQYDDPEFDDCNEFCGGGLQSRDLSCLRVVTTETTVSNETVDNEICESMGVMRPASVRQCNNRPCPIYIVEEYSQCSRSCRFGMRTRNISCWMAVLDNVTNVYDFNAAEEVPLESCFNFSLQAVPRDSERCNERIPCPVRYLPSAYGECDDLFCQQRSVSCVNFDPSDPTEAWPADEAICADQQLGLPSTVRACGGGICSFGAWAASSTENCSVPCGIGFLKREINCINITDNTVIEDGFCNAQQRPSEEVVCFIQNCPDRCDEEPSICSIVQRFGMCKAESVASITQSCCRSCPFQATAIPPL